MNSSKHLGALSWFAILLTVGLLFNALATPTMGSEPDEAWLENVDEAIKKAKAEDKDLLMLFTGSDWCPPCIKLEKEVFAEPDFMFEVTQHYVLVKLDFPQKSEQDPAIAKQNQAWVEKYGVDGFPTVFLIDKNEKPFAIAGYEEGGFQNYLGMLEEARRLRLSRDENLELAKDQTGLDRARLLDAAISEIREEIISLYYPEIVEEIVELDKDDEAGLRTKWFGAKDAEMRKIVMTDIMMVSRLEKPEKALAFINEVLAEIQFPANDQLQIFQIKLNLARQLKDKDELVDSILDDMVNLEGVEGTTRERILVKKIYVMIGSGRAAAAMKLLDDSIANGQSNLYLRLAKGEILDSKGKFKEAVENYDAAIDSAKNSPDILIDLVSAKADALYSLKDETGALQALDNFADDTKMPTDLRAEALLHKSMIMREMKRLRQARLAENRAIQITESAPQRAELQKIIDRLHKKYGE